MGGLLILMFILAIMLFMVSLKNFIAISKLSNRLSNKNNKDTFIKEIDKLSESRKK